MDYFNRKVNKELSKFENEIPEGMEWENMKEGIYSKMPKKAKRRASFWWWSGAFVTALVILLSTLILRPGYTTREEFASSKIEKVEQNQNPVSTVGENVEVETKKAEQIVELPKQGVNDLTEENDLRIESAKELIINTPSSTVVLQQPTKEQSNYLTIETPSVTVNKVAVGSFTVVEKSTISNSGETISSKDAAVSHGFLDDSKDWDETPTIKDLLVNDASIENREIEFFSGYSVTNPVLSLDAIQTFPVFETKYNESINKIALVSSLNHFAWSQSLDNVVDLSDVETNRFSFGFGVNYKWGLSKNISLVSGLQYDLFQTTFEHTFVSYEKQSVAQPVFNVYTRQTMNSGMVEVDRVTRREIVKNNRYHRLQVPVVVEASARINKVSYGVGFGVGLNALVKNTGVSIGVDDQYIDLSDRSHFTKATKVSLLLRPFVGYSVNETIEINAGFSVDRGILDWITYPDYGQKPMILSLQLSTVYKM